MFYSLKSMNVSSIDFQIRSLYSISMFCAFLNMLASVLEIRQDFELVQSYLATFLNIHREQLWNINENDLNIKQEIDFWGEEEDDSTKQATDTSQNLLNEQKELTLVRFYNYLHKNILFFLGSRKDI